MGTGDFEILLRLKHAPPAGLRLRALFPTVPLTQPPRSRAVARPGQRGWLPRAPAADDRRGLLVSVTPAGRTLLRRAMTVPSRLSVICCPTR